MRLRVRSRLRVGAAAVYAWHMAPGAFLSLVPPWEWVRLVGADRGIYPGCLRKLLVSPLRIPWWALHDQFEAGHHFRDVQQWGPFRSWAHSHRFEDGAQADESWLVDEIEFELPAPLLSGGLLPLLRAQFESMFLYRHRVTDHYLSLQRGGRPLRVAVTGSSGMVGGQLVPFLRSAGHEVIRLVRRPVQAEHEVRWDPTSSQAMPELEGLDGVIHLAGKGVLDGNFGAAHRSQIYTSRVQATSNLSAALAALQRPPGVFVSASGTGYYGASEQVCAEQSPAGQDFLAKVCLDWEAASEPLGSVGTRRVALRIAPILSLRGGALPLWYWTTLLGPSWRWGSGRQPFSWISLDDTLGMLYTALQDERWSGPINAAAPQSTTLGECARAVGEVLGGRPQWVLPERLLQWALGDRLAGASVRPGRALDLGYGFRDADLLSCLRRALGRFGSQDRPTDWTFEWG